MKKVVEIFSCDRCGREVAKEEISNWGISVSVEDNEEGVQRTNYNDLCSRCQDVVKKLLAKLIIKKNQEMKEEETLTEEEED